MTAAPSELTRMWPDAEIVRMAHNNPGFHVRVGPDDNVTRYVEVKGTSLSRPTFFLTEGERQFSMLNTSKYSILVIYSIDLVGGTYETFRHDGAIEQDPFILAARQRQCEVRADRR